jgi:hypothetical protein
MEFNWNEHRGAQPEALGYWYHLNVCQLDDSDDSDEWTWRVFLDDLTRLTGPRFESPDAARLDCERVVQALAPLLLAEAQHVVDGSGDRPAWARAPLAQESPDAR